MFTDIVLPEILGTATLILLGCGVVANVTLARTGGASGGYLMIVFGWGLGVFAGVYVAYKSGAHLNPAVTLGLVASGDDLGGDTALKALAYIGAQMVGAILGATLAWLAYRDQFDDADSEPDAKLGVFCTAPQVRRTTSNLATEIIATFLLVFVILSFDKTPSELGPLPVALLVVAIGASLGGPTGYAINPARDLGPRIAHFLLPIKGKRDSNWSYSWIPVVGPAVGGILGGLVAAAANYV